MRIDHVDVRPRIDMARLVYLASLVHVRLVITQSGGLHGPGVGVLALSIDP